MSLKIENALKHLYSKICSIPQQLSTVVNYTGLRWLFCSTVLFPHCSLLAIRWSQFASLLQTSFFWVEHYGSGLRFAMSCGESQGEDKSVKFCDFRLTEGNCLCDSSGWTRLDDVITHDIFLSFVHSLIRITAKIVLAPFFRAKNYHLSASFTLIQAPLCACKKKRHICWSYSAELKASKRSFVYNCKGWPLPTTSFNDC